MELEKIEIGRLTLRLSKLDLVPIVNDCVEHARALFEIANLRVAAPLAAQDVPEVLADSIRVKQILLNLLSNAVKFNCPGGEVTVDVAVASDGVSVLVSDQGEGIAASRQQEIFEPSTRSSTGEAHAEGSGRGLALARRLARSMGGELDVQSRPGAGSTFRLSLPLAETSASAPLAKPDASASATKLGTTASRDALVLYIEDIAANAALVRDVLELDPRMSFLHAATGQDGIRIATEELPALILLDLNLPDISGFEVMRALAADPRTAKIPVVAVSGVAVPDQINRGLEAGFKAYITKPFRVDMFLKEVHRALDDGSSP